MRSKFLKQKAVFMIYLTISLIFTVYLMQPVFAEDDTATTNACCERTVSGDSCIYTNIENCDENYDNKPFQYCEDTQMCKVGCCVSEEDGSCSKQTSKATCEVEGFQWYENPNCELVQCQKGCCVLAEASCAFVTEDKCEAILENYPELTKDFRESESEVECTDICREKDRGCCVTEGGDSCIWAARDSCGLPDGLGEDGFYKDVFCSNDNLPCDCEYHGGEKKCLEGTDDIYWFDSCGNPEDIDEHCDYAKEGTVCSEADEENDEPYCRSVDCEDTWMDDKNPDETGIKRYNGESWCSYDSVVGPTFDVVGSRHYRHICVNGEEIVEPCRDFREEVCKYFTMEEDISPRGVEMDGGACIENRWQDCTSECKTAEEEDSESEKEQKMVLDKKCCERLDLRDCVWVGDESHGVCMPLITPGFKFWTDDEGGPAPSADAVSECEKGNHEMTTIWGKMLAESDWDCEVHCEVYGDEYLSMRNEYCRSLGDCGAHYNYKGVFSDAGIFRSWEGKPHGDPKVFVDTDMVGDYEENWSSSGQGLYLGKIGASWGGWDKWGEMWETTGYTLLGTTLVASALGAVIMGIGIAAASIGAAGFGFFAMVAGGPILGVVAAIIALILTWPQEKKKKVEVTCQPWQAPMGGSRCEECDQEMKPCSEYRCRSLGSTCRFIHENEGTGKNTCFNSHPNDVTNPIIKWDDGVFQVISKREDVTSSYDTKPIQQGRKVEGEIPSFSRVTFGIMTDELSQCFVDTEFKDPMTFVDLITPFPDTYFSKEHNISYNNLLPDTEYKFYIGCRDPVGNPDVDDYITPFVVELKTDAAPDLSAPYIVGTELPELGKVPAYKNDTFVSVYVDEPSYFSYRIAKEDQDYELMTQEMACASTEPASIFGDYSTCAARFNVSEGPNTVYIRCKDNPINAEPNTMTESYAVTFEKTMPLTITAAGPSGEFYQKDITMYVQTVGGVDNGRSKCAYIGTQASGIFGTTNVSYHENIFSDLLQNTYVFNITCVDDIGNNAETQIIFSSMRDTTAPQLKNVYKQGSTVYLLTDEPVTCEYANDTFSYGYGTTSAVNTKTHVLSGNDRYNVICEDLFGNRMDEVIVYPYLPKIEKVSGSS